jgi:hypothetical protein
VSDVVCFKISVMLVFAQVEIGNRVTGSSRNSQGSDSRREQQKFSKRVGMKRNFVRLPRGLRKVRIMAVFNVEIML